MATDFESIMRSLPSSSLIHFCDAREITGKFGFLAAELNDPKRYSRDDLNNRRTFSLPLERLGYSKEQVQIALAVVVAELVLRLAVESSDLDREFLNAAIPCSGSLAYFTRQPVPGFKYIEIEAESTFVYAGWRKTCELFLGEITGEPAKLREDTCGWERALVKYWQAIDRMIPDLLSDSALAAIRAT